MKVARLEIEQQRAEITIDIVNARLHVEMPEQDMDITSKPAEMFTECEDPEVILDLTELKANTGLKTYDQLLSEAATKASGKALQSIKDIVNTAAFVGDVAIHGNKIGKMAREKMLRMIEPDMGRSPVPPGPVKMKGYPGKLEIDWSKHEFYIDWIGKTMPEIYVEPPCSVEVEISTKPYIRISVKEIYIPASSGRNVNTEV
jgi:hypothetical protein